MAILIAGALLAALDDAPVTVAIGPEGGWTDSEVVVPIATGPNGSVSRSASHRSVRSASAH